MSAKVVNEKAAVRSYTIRGQKKECTIFKPTETLTKEYHLELGEHYETVVVEDRPTDWAELANKDVDKVGLKNVLDTIQRQGLDVRTACRFNDSEALDLSELDPLDTHAYQHAKENENAALKSLEATAAKLGVSVDSLVAAAISGRVEDLVKTSSTSTEKEGDK